MRSRLVLAAFLLLSVPACLQPGEVPGDDEPGNQADAGPGNPNPSTPDADLNNPPPPGNPDAAPQGGDPTFTADVYPLLGACQGCHVSGGVAAFMPLADGADNVYPRIMGRPGVVNVDTPEESLILRKPLNGSGLNHRVKLFNDTNNATYIAIKAWIEAGALQ